MNRDARQKLRLTIHIIHAIVQVVLLYLVADAGFSVKTTGGAADMADVYRVVSLLARSMMAFGIQYSLLKIFSGQEYSHHSHS